MVRSLSSAQKLLIDDRVDLEPIIVVKIVIGASVYWYADKDFTFTVTTTNDTVADGRLETVSDIQFNSLGQTSSTISTVSLELDDADEVIRTILNTKSYNDADVIIYMALNTVFNDFTELFSGQIRSPYSYDDVTRLVAFDVIPKINSVQFPWAPTDAGTDDGDNNTHPLLLGKPWPIGFGRVTDAPVQLYKQPDLVKLRSAIDESSGISFDVDVVPDFQDANPHHLTTNREYMIGRELINGAWNSTNKTRFNVASGTNARNRIIITGTAIARPTSGADPDTARKDVIYIAQRIVGQWVKLTANGNTQERYCISQVGTKCFFDSQWSSKISNGKSFTTTRYSTKSGTRWVHQSGIFMRRNEGDGGQKKVYVFSDGPVNSVKSVRAWRQVPILGGPSSGSMRRELVYVPSSFYTIDLNASGTRHDLPGLINVKAATIKFDPALEFRQMGWEADEIYVSYVSDYATGNERNIVEHISYIIETYTDLTIDAVSKAAVKLLVNNFPADWQATKQMDALAAATIIAEQALIALVITGTQVKFKYLGINDPIAGDGQFQLTDSNCILMDTTEVLVTELEDIYTIYKGTYRNSYAFDMEQSITIKTNVDQFDERPKTVDFNIYQRRKLVKPFVEWWARQLAYPWKILKINIVLPGIEYEPFDIIAMDSSISSIFGVSSIAYGRVMTVRNSLSAYTQELEIWVPVVDGTTVIATYGYVAPTTPPTAVRADPFANYPTTFNDEIEAVAVPFDGS